jgi:uncharacterized membrane protein
MYSKVKVLGHPIHPMLVPLVIGSYVGALFGYLIFAATPGPFWFHFGYVCNLTGVLMAVVAAIPGFIDWLWGIPRETAAKGGRSEAHGSERNGISTLFSKPGSLFRAVEYCSS